MWAYMRKTTIQKDTCTPTFTAALLTIAKHGPRKMSTDRLKLKMQDMDKMDYEKLPLKL